MWRRWQGPTPGYNGQAAQLTEARAEYPWLAVGSQTVQQQALRDLDPTWTRRGGTSSPVPMPARPGGSKDNLRGCGSSAPKPRGSARIIAAGRACWCRRSAGSRSDAPVTCRTTRPTGSRGTGPGAGISRSPRSRSRSRHPGPVPFVGVDRGVKAAAALSTGKLSSPAGPRRKAAERLLRLQRRLARGRHLGRRPGYVESQGKKATSGRVDRARRSRGARHVAPRTRNGPRSVGARPGDGHTTPERLASHDLSGNGPRRLVRPLQSVSYTHLRAHETVLDLVCRLLLEK